jgi:hypothetical protein
MLAAILAAGRRVGNAKRHVHKKLTVHELQKGDKFTR